MKINGNVEVPDDAIAAFCHRWRVTQIEAFGSSLRDDFGPESDVDLLVAFDVDASVDLIDLIKMRDEMAQILGRPVDLFERSGVKKSKNPFRRRAILSSARVVYSVA